MIMAAIPNLDEIEATVVRMEQRYRHEPAMVAYRRLSERFAIDLSDRRDLALAKSAALMMVRELARDLS
jgi:hypothetical protein